jgi:ABC-2 type transport system ATP-binding protein
LLVDIASSAFRHHKNRLKCYSSVNALEVLHISKSFGSTRAVADISFSVQKGEIFGLLGPNGSGKTTTIRLALDIFKPDCGAISILGGPITETKKNRIGYMPEERGLYQDTTLERCLFYLASLKGMAAGDIKLRLNEYLKRFDLAQYKNKKVKTLSKGMQQKAQIILTVLHEPELLIIDEPFTGLDPINTQVVKEMMHELRDQGAAIIMSTHQMHQVEELCDRIVLIDQGKSLLYGPLDDIRHQYAGHAVLVKALGAIPAVSGVTEISYENKTAKLMLAANTNPQAVLDALREQQVVLEKFEIAAPTLDEIFIRAVKEAPA